MLALLALVVLVSPSCTAFSLCQLAPCFGLLQPLLYKLHFAGHAGIACLSCVCRDSMSSFPTCDWSQLHAGIVCLTFLAYDWANACWDSISTTHDTLSPDP